MLNMIAGVYPIDSGKIVIDGINISREPEQTCEIHRKGFPDPDEGTAANMEIQENLAMALRRGKIRDLAGESGIMRRIITGLRLHNRIWAFRRVGDE